MAGCCCRAWRWWAIDLDETLGPLLDPLGPGATVPPASDPVFRLLRSRKCCARNRRRAIWARRPAAAARSIVRSMDRMAVEDVAPEKLLDEAVIGAVGDLSQHWRTARGCSESAGPLAR
jgi:ATP-dependent helicase/nuclease subunit B